MTPPAHFAAPPADSSVRPGAAVDPLDRVGAGAVSAYLSRLDAGRRELDAAGTALSNAGRAADAPAMAVAADRYEAATAALQSLAAERTALLTQSGAESVAVLAASNPALVFRVKSLRESASETRTRLWPRWVSARRSAAACAEALDLIARGGVRSVTYAAGGGAEAAGGGALLNLSG
ncbi:hypothetical protein [Alienimonas californiensis]|uniref:Uncharacterized protein n=1 Tax=Alienimonas californiensis TaxID=2527989 RepID=A0A517P3X6_9PLAN|nr:hypothetical protein [Alienimonas californiensis]QDT14094.1 hypothetical protein CA12_01620 [Alienimonas californiensis]